MLLPLKNKSVTAYIILFVFVIVCSIYGYYTLFNGELLRNDESHNLEFAQKIYIESADQGVVEFITDLYQKRHLRPNIHTPLASVFFYFLNPNFELVYAFMTMLQLVVLFLICTKLLKHKKEPEKSLILLAVFMTSYLFHGLTFASSEGLGLVFMAALIFYYNKFSLADFFSNARSQDLICFSVFSGLFILTKPVEGFLIVTSLLVFFLFNLPASLGQKLKYLLTLFAIFSGPFAYCAYLILQKINNSQAHIGLFIFSLITLLFSFLKLRDEKFKKIFYLFLPCVLLCYLWYAPYVYNLYLWAYDSSIGTMAQKTGNRGTENALLFILNAINKIIGPLALLLVTLIFAFAIQLRRELILFISACSIPLLFGAFTHNGDLRYYIFTGFGVTLIIFAQPFKEKIKPFLRYLILIGTGFLALANIWHTTSVFGRHQPLPYFLNSTQWGLWPRPFTHREDPIRELTAILTKEVNLSTQNQSCVLRMATNSPVNPIFDPWLATMLLRKQGFDSKIIMPFPHEYSNTQDRLQYVVQQKCCYVFVYPTDYIPNVPVAHYMNDVGQVFIEKHHLNMVNEIGFEYLKKLNFNFYNTSSEMLIFRNLRTQACAHSYQ